MRVRDFHFHLPPELIAQHPPEIRGGSRMLVLDRTSGTLADRLFTDLPSLLYPGDLLVLNDSRVLPARLFATRARSSHAQRSSPDPSGRIEVLLTRNLEPQIWTALCRPARKLELGDRLLFHAAGDHHPLLEAEILSTGCFGERTLRFQPTPRFFEIIDCIGHLPLPPYIHRDQATSPDTAHDRDRYQTVFAGPSGSEHHRSAAAPTAGLHFTPAILAELRAHGVRIEYLTLHVGLGTFQPVRVDDLADIRLHAEPYTLPSSTAAAINLARAEGRRIVAVGTTVTRTLEHCALNAEAGGRPDLHPHSGSTSVFLSPGHRFRLVGALLTNFHLPESTLLMLVSAFAGRDAVLHAYAHAVEQRYRFFSFGDCMLLL